jgi:hypothetical protein
VNDALERIYKEAVGAYFLEHYSGIHLEGLTDSTKKTAVRIAGLRAEI